MKNQVFTSFLLIAFFGFFNQLHAQWSTSSGSIFYNGGRVSIGTSTIGATDNDRLLVQGGITSMGANAGFNFVDRTNGARGFSLFGQGNLLTLFTNEGNKNLLRINSTNGDISWGSSRGLLVDYASSGASIELGGRGTPYIDFSNDLSVDYDARIMLRGDGKLAIEGASLAIGEGTNPKQFPAGFKLAVEGKVIAEEVQVDLKGNWPDYVFTPAHRRLSLPALEQFVLTNKHLPNIPSAAEVKAKGGIELGDMNVRLLEKVEELTLYIIEQQQHIEQLQQAVQNLQKSNKQ
jgi:hypothetical protein